MGWTIHDADDDDDDDDDYDNDDEDDDDGHTILIECQTTRGCGNTRTRAYTQTNCAAVATMPANSSHTRHAHG